jgi:hypothetical protein
MTTICNSYATETEALHAIEALRAEGDVWLLAGGRPGDVRREVVGGFAGPVGPDAPVGTYAGAPVLRRQAAGAFAGDPDRHRQGSFADTDRITIVIYRGDAERTRITGLRGVRRLLERKALDDRTVEHAVSELHKGHAIVLAAVAAARIVPVARAA